MIYRFFFFFWKYSFHSVVNFCLCPQASQPPPLLSAPSCHQSPPNSRAARLLSANHKRVREISESCVITVASAKEIPARGFYKLNLNLNGFKDTLTICSSSVSGSEQHFHFKAHYLHNIFIKIAKTRPNQKNAE